MQMTFNKSRLNLLMIFFLKKTFFVYSIVVVICGFHFDIEFSLNQQWVEVFFWFFLFVVFIVI
jgi:hypothetical protein